MIKLEVEIKDDEFHYSYTVGENRHSSSGPLNADTLASFTDLLRHCSNIHKFRDKEFERELWGKAYAEKHGLHSGHVEEKK